MTGKQAFDELVRFGFMEVNELGLGRIVKAPKVTRGPRGHRELDWFVKCVRTLGAWGNEIEAQTGCDGDDLRFRKRERRLRLCSGCRVNHPHEHRCHRDEILVDMTGVGCCECEGCNPTKEALEAFKLAEGLKF